jgi:hypothetical protein
MPARREQGLPGRALKHLQVHAAGSRQVQLVIYSDDNNHPDAAFSLTRAVDVPASVRRA